MQFRFEFFNAFNSVNYGGNLPVNFYNGLVNCGASACSITNNTITSTVGGVDGNFGKANGTKGGREIQYAFKLYF